MSFYMAHHAVIKIKPDLQNDFFYLFNGEYDKIENPVLREFAEDYFVKGSAEGYYSEELKSWSHHDYLEEWAGKYPTSYKDGIFSYSNYYNAYGFLASFYNDFEDKILPLITDEIIEQGGWCEPL